MADPIQRVHYFDHQFLHVDDFETEQGYHVEMRRRHNRVLHTPGIAEGLRVTFASGSNVTAVTVRAGTAVDSQGRELVLVGDQTVELASFADRAPVFIAISYRQVEARQTTETGVTGNTRLVENPLVEALTSAPDNVDRLLLARVNRGVGSNAKQIAGVDESGRILAGSIEGDVVLTPRDPSFPQTQWVTLGWSAANRADLLGTLNVRKSGTGVEGNLTVEGRLGVGLTGPANRLDVLGQGVFRSAQWAGPTAGTAALMAGFDPANAGGTGLVVSHDAGGASTRLWLDGDPIIFAPRGAEQARIGADGNLGIGTTAPIRRLHVENSEIHSGGSIGGFSFADRGTTGPLDNAGERWVWYSQGKIARLWTSAAADLLFVTADGKLGLGVAAPTTKLDVGGDIKFGSILSTDGRMHLTGGELLYLLHKNGVIIGKEWGGTGDLSVQGTINAGRINNVAIGTLGFAPEWAGFSHADAAGIPSYGLLQHNDGRWTLLNKRSGGGNIEFRIDNGTRLAMDDTGRLAVDGANANDGTVDPARGAASASIVFGGLGSGEGIASKRTATANQWGLDFYTAYQRRVWITNTGVVFAGSAWNIVSDRALKKNVKALGGGLDRVRQLDVIRFEWKKTATKSAGLGADDLAEAGAQIGLLADQVAEQFPELVSDWEGDDGKTYRALDYGRVGAVLIEAIKELADRVDELTDRVEKLSAGSSTTRRERRSR